MNTVDLAAILGHLPAVCPPDLYPPLQMEVCGAECFFRHSYDPRKNLRTYEVLSGQELARPHPLGDLNEVFRAEPFAHLNSGGLDIQRWISRTKTRPLSPIHLKLGIGRIDWYFRQHRLTSDQIRAAERIICLLASTSSEALVSRASLAGSIQRETKQIILICEEYGMSGDEAYYLLEAVVRIFKASRFS